MIEENGIVAAVHGDLAEVESQRRSTCGGCSVNGACGTSLLERFFGRRQLILTVRNPVGARPGDAVVVGVPEAALLQASLVAYLLPLAAMIAGAIAGTELAAAFAPGWTSAASVLGGAGGFATGIWWLSRFSAARADDPRYQAVILRRAAAMPVEVSLTPPAVPQDNPTSRG